MPHKVSHSPTEARGVVVNFIRRPLKGAKTFSIRPIRLRNSGAGAEVARAVADRLDLYFAEVDAQHSPVAEAEASAALDEAMRHVRPT